MKVISFSIWGNNPLYVEGIKENIELAKEYYPGWICKIYYDKTFDISQVDNLKNDAIFQFINDSEGLWHGLYWRFYAVSEPENDIVIIRDLDSRINSREAVAVKEWEESDYQFHSMRDNIHHNVPIMGGMWGCKKGTITNMKELVNFYSTHEKKGTDQYFLQKFIWKLVRERTLAHDKFNNGFYLLKDGTMFFENDIEEYNPWDNCGDLKDYNFPKGKIILKNGTVLKREEVYEYKPLELFGLHKILPFPPHEPMKHGKYVGESTLDYPNHTKKE